MKILFCTPYRKLPGVIFSGINIWARNILEYYETLNDVVELIPVSYDRVHQVDAHTSLPKRALWGLWDYIMPIKETKKVLKTQNIDVLHLCSSASISLLKDLYVLKHTAKRNIKTSIHFHFGRIPELIEKNNWEAKLLLRVCRIADAVIVMDRSSFSALKKKGVNNVSYVPNPLSPKVIDEIDNLPIGEKINNKKILFVGHVIPSKGVYELVQACSQIDGVELHLIGTVNESVKNELVRIASRKSNGAWLKIRGGIPHEDVIKEMLSCAVFVLPSYTEGFPNVILESMACGCPIVSTNVGAMPDMLDVEHENQCGVCVSPKDVNGLYKAIVEMINNKYFAMQCSINAQKRVKEEYSIEEVWCKLKSIWENIRM